MSAQLSIRMRTFLLLFLGPMLVLLTVLQSRRVIGKSIAIVETSGTHFQIRSKRKALLISAMPLLPFLSGFRYLENTVILATLVDHRILDNSSPGAPIWSNGFNL